MMISNVHLTMSPVSFNISTIWHGFIAAWLHYNDVIMGSMASQITSLTIVYSTVYSAADQRKHQSSASLAFVRGIHRGPVISPHKWPVTRKMFPFDEKYDRWKCYNDIQDCTDSLCLRISSSGKSSLIETSSEINMKMFWLTIFAEHYENHHDKFWAYCLNFVVDIKYRKGENRNAETITHASLISEIFNDF